MQQIETTSFVFDLPIGWTYFAEDGRLVCNGPDEEVLIISVTTAKNAHGEVGDVYIDHLLENAVHTMREMHADPELIEMKAPALEPSANLSCMWALARTPDN